MAMFQCTLIIRRRQHHRLRRHLNRHPSLQMVSQIGFTWDDGAWEPNLASFFFKQRRCLCTATICTLFTKKNFMCVFQVHASLSPRHLLTMRPVQTFAVLLWCRQTNHSKCRPLQCHVLFQMVGQSNFMLRKILKFQAKWWTRQWECQFVCQLLLMGTIYQANSSATIQLFWATVSFQHDNARTEQRK